MSSVLIVYTLARFIALGFIAQAFNATRVKLQRANKKP